MIKIFKLFLREKFKFVFKRKIRIHFVRHIDEFKNKHFFSIFITTLRCVQGNAFCCVRLMQY